MSSKDRIWLTERPAWAAMDTKEHVAHCHFNFCPGELTEEKSRKVLRSHANAKGMSVSEFAYVKEGAMHIIFARLSEAEAA